MGKIMKNAAIIITLIFGMMFYKTTLFAEEKTSYTVTIDYNGADVIVPDFDECTNKGCTFNIKNGRNIDESIPNYYFYSAFDLKPSDLHKSLKGFSKNTDGTGKVISPGELFVHKPESDENWYAIWDNTYYLVNVVLDDGESLKYHYPKLNCSSKGCVVQVKKGSSIDEYLNVINNDPHKIFNGFSNVKSGEPILETDSAFYNHVPVSDETWYPVWNNGHIVKLRDDNGYFDSDRTKHEKTIIVPSGKDLNSCYLSHFPSSTSPFLGWIPEGIEPNRKNITTSLYSPYSYVPQKDCELYAYYNDIYDRVTLAFNYEGGGYSGGVPYNRITECPNDKVIISGDYYKKQVKEIKDFLVNSDDYFSGPHYHYYFDCSYPLSSTGNSFKRFVGWSTNGERSGIIKDIDSFELTEESYTFTAIYDTYAAVNIVSKLSSTYYYPKLGTKLSEIKDLPTPYKDEYRDFVGYSYSADNSTGLINLENEEINQETVTIYEIYKPRKIKISLVENEVDVAPNTTWNIGYSIEPYEYRRYLKNVEWLSEDDHIAKVTPKDDYGEISYGRDGTTFVDITGEASNGIIVEGDSVKVIAKAYLKDVFPDTPHYEDILWMYSNNISEGWLEADGNRTYRPMNSVVRQDMAAFLRREARKLGISDAATWNPTASDWKTFRDVNRNTPHAEDILWLAHAGISTGWTEGDGTKTYRGMDTVKRQDMAAFLHRLANLANIEKEGSMYFIDVSYSTPHAEDISWLGGTGISTGYSDGAYQGMWPVYRQDMAAFIHRLDNLKQ